MANPAKPNQRFITLLQERSPSTVSDPQYRTLAIQHVEGSLGFLCALIDNHLLEGCDAARLWADSLGIAYVNPLETPINAKWLRLAPRSEASEKQFIPTSEVDGVLTVAMADPEELEKRAAIENVIGKPISPVFALPKEIEAAIALNYSGYDEIRNTLSRLEREVWRAVNFTKTDLSTVLRPGALEAWLEQLSSFLLRCEGRSLHFSPSAERSQIRMRLGSQLYNVVEYSDALHRLLMSHFDQIVLKRINVAESISQTEFSTRSAEYDLVRQSGCRGTSTVLKLRCRKLARESNLFRRRKRKRNYSMFLQERLTAALRQPYGMILIGVRNVHEQYSAIATIADHLDAKRRSVFYVGECHETLPVGIQNIVPEHKRGAALSKNLSAALQNDADIIISEPVSEPRYFASLIDAAFSGRLVIAMVEAGDAWGAVARANLLTTSTPTLAQCLHLVLAQTEVPHLDSASRKAFVPNRFELQRFFADFATAPETRFYRPGLSSSKPWQAYDGMITLHDVLVVSQEVRALIASGPQSPQFWKSLPLGVYRPMRYDGLVKAALGFVALEDIERSTINILERT